MAATKLQGRGPSKDGIELNSPTYLVLVPSGESYLVAQLIRVRNFFLIWALADRTIAVTPLDLVSPRVTF